MAKVRVWDRDQKWLWPNLPYLLRAHGKERVERYGGVDPGKGIDNDFAAVLIRPLQQVSSGTKKLEPSPSAQPLVSAEWYPADVQHVNKNSVVHVARSDEFRVRLRSENHQLRSARLGIWLIYADFLGARMPRDWPSKGEYDGGILAYFEVSWQASPVSELRFDIKHLVPATDTGFDWELWSTGTPALSKHLDLTHPPEMGK
jgi:hypothetical protein